MGNNAPRILARSLLAMLVVLLFSAVALIIYWLNLPTPGEIEFTSLPPERRFIAQDLLGNDGPRSFVSSGISFNYTLAENANGNAEQICVFALLPTNPLNETQLAYSHLLINGIIVPDAHTAQGTERSGPLTPVWCAVGALQDGLHLIEFEFRDEPSGNPDHFVAWAFTLGVSGAAEG